MPLTALSQRDPRWGDIPLGFSQAPISSYGCTITALAVYLGTTPDVVNERLKKVNGFSDGSTIGKGNLVVWAKVKEAFPGVEITKLGWTWDLNDVLNNVPCLVEVDFDGTENIDNRHWVLYIGNSQMVDPWTGTVENIKKYKPLSYRLIKGSWIEKEIEHPDYYKELDLTNKESMRVAVDVWDRLKRGELVEKEKYESQEKAASQCQIQLKTALDQVDALQKTSDVYRIKAEELQEKYDAEARAVINLNAQIAAIKNEDKDYATEAYESEKVANELHRGMEKIANELELQYDPAQGKSLVDEILKEIVLKEQQLKNAQEYSQLKVVLRSLIGLGMNEYLTSQGKEPVNPEQVDATLEEKVSLFLQHVQSGYKLPTLTLPKLPKKPTGNIFIMLLELFMSPKAGDVK